MPIKFDWTVTVMDLVSVFTSILVAVIVGMGVFYSLQGRVIQVEAAVSHIEKDQIANLKQTDQWMLENFRYSNEQVIKRLDTLSQKIDRINERRQ